MSEVKLPKLKILIASIPVAFLLVVALAATPKVSMENTETGTLAKSDGRSDYAAQCAKCHGADGRSQTAKGRQTHADDLTKSTVSDEKGIRMITNGRGEMPGFKNSLSAEQIKAVMEYTHAFRR